MNHKHITDEEVLNLKEDDTLVVKVNFTYIPKVKRQGYCKKLHDNIKKVYPNNNVMIISNDVELSILRVEKDESIVVEFKDARNRSTLTYQHMLENKVKDDLKEIYPDTPVFITRDMVNLYTYNLGEDDDNI